MKTQTSSFVYRRAHSADIAQLKALGLVSYGQYVPLLTNENADKFRANMNSDETWLPLLQVADGFVVTKEEVIVGMAFLVPSGNPWDIFIADWSYIRLVGVHPDHSGKGIATELTRLCIQQARDNNEKILALHTSEIMPAARHIYEKAGFTQLREIGRRLGQRYWLYTLNLKN